MRFIDKKIDDVIIFKDEPHFQYEMLYGGIPIRYKDEVYYPLVAEFPASPGIDLIYYSEKRNIILAELKYNVTNYELSQKEAVHHFIKYKAKKIKDLIIFCELNEYEMNKKQLKRFKEVFSYETELSLADLYESERLYSVCIYNGSKPDKIKTSLVDILFVEYDEKNIRIQTYKNKNEDIGYINIYNDYEIIKKKQGSKRYHRNNEELHKKVCNSGSNLLNIIFLIAKKEEYIITSGSGKELTFKVQIEDREGKKKSILIAHEDKIEIPGNLYYQQRNIGRTAKDIDDFFENVNNFCMNYRIKKTKAGTLQIYLDNFNRGYIVDLFKILELFRNKVMKSG